VGLAVSRDSRQIAISMATRELAVVDEHFKLIHRHSLDCQADTPLFLSTGEILIGDNSRIVRLDSRTGKRLRTWKMPGKVMSVDDNEKFLVSSRQVSPTGEDRHKAFGVTVLHLPSMKVHWKYSIPRMQLTSPVLSPDGKLLAVEAAEVDSYRTKLLVFDNATGHVVAERKLEMAGRFMFLPDCRTLIDLERGHQIGEAMGVWIIPPSH
jgi:hypothetical protein